MESFTRENQKCKHIRLIQNICQEIHAGSYPILISVNTNITSNTHTVIKNV